MRSCSEQYQLWWEMILTFFVYNFMNEKNGDLSDFMMPEANLTKQIWTYCQIMTVIIISSIILLVGYINAAGNSSELCGLHEKIAVGKELIINVTNSDVPPGQDCSFTLTGQQMKFCLGLCFDMRSISFFNGVQANLTVSFDSEKHFQVFNNETVFNGSWCIKKMNISLSLAVAVDNQLDNDATNYELSFTAYNNCDKKRWLTFEEALKHLKGYHHGDEFHNNTYGNKVRGILVGTGLAVMFLILLAVNMLYYLHKRKKTRERETVIPQVSFKKKLQQVKVQLAETSCKQRHGDDCGILMKN